MTTNQNPIPELAGEFIRGEVLLAALAAADAKRAERLDPHRVVVDEHVVTIEFDWIGHQPDYSMTCKAPTAAPCHADYDCSCGMWSETGVEGGRPWHESYGGERHYGTYDPTTCGVRAWFESSDDVAELIKGRAQFSVQPEWEGEWYEYRIIETAPVDLLPELMGGAA